jgi:hypothetical protein
MKGNQNGLDNGGDTQEFHWKSAKDGIHFEHWVCAVSLYIIM